MSKHSPHERALCTGLFGNINLSEVRINRIKEYFMYYRVVQCFSIDKFVHPAKLKEKKKRQTWSRYDPLFIAVHKY